MENEYARIAVEQGLLGVLLWMCFACWALLRNPLELRRFGGAVDLGMWTFCTFTWVTGFVGTGFLASVPGTLVLFLFMGGLLASRDLSSAREPVAPRLSPVAL
jgi:O-antigen ligase